MIAEAAAKEEERTIHPPTTIPSILPDTGRYVESVGTLKTDVLQTEFFSKR